MIIAVFGVFVIGTTIFTTGKMRRIGDAYSAMGDHEVAAALAATRANHAFATSRGAVGELLLSSTDAGNQLATASLEASRGEMTRGFDEAIKAMPGDADLVSLKAASFAILGNDCARSISEGAAANTEATVAASQVTFLRECSPKFPPLSKRLSDKATALQVTARDKDNALIIETNHAIVLTFGIILGGLVLVGGCAIYAVRSWISAPMSALEGVMKRLAGGELDAVVSGADRRDELGAMAKAVQVFKEAGIEKGRLESVTADARRAAEEERARNQRQAENLRAMADAVVANVGRALKALADGDLTHRIHAEVPAEVANLASLKDDLNAAMEKMHQALSLVAANARGIHSGTGEIGQAADDLSRRTEQQAASLEETAAALDEITATVNKTAEGANIAKATVSQAKSDAECSKQVVRDAVHAMDAIEDSARQITQIIGVIDEIAFQTNLLALNAGVEAARAGDAGRGFAVVASEVRMLAQRSAEAAKDIKRLISTSSQQVERGASLVGETGRALEQIVSQVVEISVVVSEIAASAQEQAAGLQQVNIAVNQMDQVTQQNAAMVEESTAASHAISGEAQELASLVDKFKLGDVNVGRVLRAAPSRVSPARPKSGRPALKMLGGGAALKASSSSAGESWSEF